MSRRLQIRWTRRAPPPPWQRLPRLARRRRRSFDQLCNDLMPRAWRWVPLVCVAAMIAGFAFGLWRKALP